MILIVGYAVLCAAFKPGVRHWLQIIGLSYAAGSGVIPLLLFMASVLGVKPNRWILLGILIAAIALLIFCRKKKRGFLIASVPTPRRKFSPMTVLGLLGLSILLLSASNVWARAGWPVMFNIDVFGIWLFKAKWVFYQPLRPLPFAFSDPILSYSHQDYPLSFPFLVAGFYTAVGRVDDTLVKLLMLPIYLALISVMYSGLRLIHRRATALAITAVFAAAPILSVSGGSAVAETPLILASSCALILLVAWIETGETGCLPLAALFAAIAAFSKNEGLAMLPVLAVVALIGSLRWPGRQTFRQGVIAAVVCIVAIGPWIIFRIQLPKTHENYGEKLTSASAILHNLSRLHYVLPAFLGRCFDVPNAGLIWIVLIVSAITGWRAFRTRAVWLLWCVLLIQLSLYIGTFIVTPWRVEELLPVITARLLSQATPIVALLIGLHLRWERSQGWSDAVILRTG
jgi:hypothetical protein